MVRNLVLKPLIQSSFTRPSTSSASLLLLLSSPHIIQMQIWNSTYGGIRTYVREGPEVSPGLNWALAAKGVIVQGKVFPNLTPSELKQSGATIAQSLTEFLVHVRGSVVGGASEISKAQFGKLIKQVTNHLSSTPNIFVHDGAIGSSPKCDAKLRVISDSPSAILSLSNILYKTPSRSVSHDSCPLTVYVATSISPSVVEAVGVGSYSNGLIAADIERSFLVLCGEAFSDASGTKKALSALSEPVIAARGGIPLPARILVSGGSVIILFAPEDTIQSCADSLISPDAGIILSPQVVAPLFQARKAGGSNLFKLPTAIVFACSDPSGCIPTVSKLSPGQAAYQFLAGYQGGNFVPAFSRGHSSIDPLELSKALLAKLKENQVSTYLININRGKETLSGKEFIQLVDSTLSRTIQPFQAKGDLEGKYRAFLLGKYTRLPDEFSF
ncbi:hypothetical protein L6164_003081 [Bauhinia variegata]|uniref:Uncharacterized protein n=1 Tax=Bauhinia variegata TaxID=167791 RepID=A0ACB9Q1P1_BAUVA|nr:hypothetical protein L6164_003081 [Bauhinia variegata]